MLYCVRNLEQPTPDGENNPLCAVCYVMDLTKDWTKCLKEAKDVEYSEKFRAECQSKELETCPKPDQNPSNTQ